jgi:DNA-binding NtrC family response regulator
MSLSAQRKVLRVIEKREVCQVGSTRQTTLDVRFVAATNQNLEGMVGEGTFRKDLFFRLSVVRVHLPPLRERRDDITPLVRHYLNEFSIRSGAPAPRLSNDCLRRLLEYDWPGNIRELKNVVEALFLADSPLEVGTDSLPDYLRKEPENGKSERDLLLEALFACEWNKSKAAQKLHWSRMTLYRKIAKYQIEDL